MRPEDKLDARILIADDQPDILQALRLLLKNEGYRMVTVASPGQVATALSGEEFDSLFDERGHWIEMPAAWADPDASLEQKQFFAALEECLARLPGKTAQVFMMREHLGLETGDICKELGVTPTHCWVLLYRARMALRECLQANWFSAR